jgi:hypothetical protein
MNHFGAKDSASGKLSSVSVIDIKALLFADNVSNINGYHWKSFCADLFSNAKILHSANEKCNEKILFLGAHDRIWEYHDFINDLQGGSSCRTN